MAQWTRAHLLELPGFAGSGNPAHELDVPEFGRCVADWLGAQDLGRVVLAGSSSGTQVAARAALGHLVWVHLHDALEDSVFPIAGPVEPRVSGEREPSMDTRSAVADISAAPQ